MVSINRYTVKANMGYGHYAALVGGEAHARFHFLITKSSAGHFLHLLFIFFTVSFFRCDFLIEFVSGSFSFEAFLDTDNKRACAMQIMKRFAAFTGLNGCSF